MLHNLGYILTEVSNSCFLVSLFTVLRLSDLHGYNNLIGWVADGCPGGGGLYGQNSVTRERGADVLWVHPLWQLVFPGEAPWNQSMLILPFFMISWYLQVTILGCDCNFLRWEVIDVQDNLPAVLPCSDLWHSTRQLSHILLVQHRRVLTAEWRQERSLCVPRPSERCQSLLWPLYPVQITGIQERREAKILRKDSARLCPVWERIPANISAENGTG